MESDKDATIESVLSQLREHLGRSAFDVVDHWDADRFAVGVARSNDHRFLVYISTFFSTLGEYTYPCEPPSERQRVAVRR